MIHLNKGFITKGSEENYAKTAAHMLNTHSELVDCSLGINPYGISSKVIEHLPEFTASHISRYPQSNDELKEILIDYWQPVVRLDKPQVQFAHGSMGVCEQINKIILGDDSRVLGYCPQFTEYICDTEKCGAEYDYVRLDEDENFKFDLERFMDKVDERYDVIYLDNPNNPTGQVLPLETVEAIVKQAEKLDIAVIVDEAYGDYMPDSNSAASLVNTCDNVFVVRSFSKAFGMAGLRVGYALMPRALAPYFEKVMIAFPINSLGQFLTRFILDDRNFLASSVEKIIVSKKRIRDAVEKLKILETDDQLPILTLVHPDPEADLYAEFLKEGILTNSCVSYMTMGRNSVRLRVPIDIEPVIRAICKIEKRIRRPIP